MTQTMYMFGSSIQHPYLRKLSVLLWVSFSAHYSLELNDTTAVCNFGDFPSSCEVLIVRRYRTTILCSPRIVNKLKRLELMDIKTGN